MLKKLMLALMPLTLLTSAVNADDGLNIDVSSIADADVNILENDLDIDVDALSADVGENSENAIEACFRRFGYRHRSWGHCHYRHFNRCHSYCRPLYSYRTICYSPPVYRCVVTPIYHYYWGCH